MRGLFAAVLCGAVVAGCGGESVSADDAERFVQVDMQEAIGDDAVIGDPTCTPEGGNRFRCSVPNSFTGASIQEAAYLDGEWIRTPVG